MNMDIAEKLRKRTLRKFDMRGENWLFFFNHNGHEAAKMRGFHIKSGRQANTWAGDRFLRRQVCGHICHCIWELIWIWICHLDLSR